MFRFSKAFSTILCIALIIAVSADSIVAHSGEMQAAASFAQDNQPPAQDDKQSKKAKKKEKRAARNKNANDDKSEPGATDTPTGKPTGGDTVEIIADAQSKNGDLFIYDGYVNATLDDIRLQADHVTFNNVTGDMVAEGNVIFDQGPDQRVAARRAEINWNSRRGTFWETTGFTNRTQTGEYIFFTATRIVKTGPDTYEMYDAIVTACEDVIPKWTFHARRAELKMGDRIILHNSVFRVKTLPAFVLPYTWIPATRSERKSGFLLPTTGTSTQKGRTLKLAYYQTLGQSADITFRGDIYTSRGLGFGAEFRAQTDEKSYMRLGIYAVKDRLFGPTGESQGGAAFIAEGQQFLPHGWVAVGNVSLVTSLQFRQVFSDDISQVINPRRESTFYANNNTHSFSFNFLASNETTSLFRPSHDPANPSGGSTVDIHIRQAPQIDMTFYPRRIFDSKPIYFSFDTSIGALKREETVDSTVVLVTPAAVQRFDFQPKITIPLATVAGIAVTPSLSLRETFYTNSLDPRVSAFDPDKFAASPTDPRLDPTNAAFNPAITLFDRNVLDPILPESISRHYAELAVDIRPPALEKDFTNADGTPRFKHLIEPYITYRLIKGIGDEFNKIIRFDERDAVANTNEFEYAIVNRFYTQRSASDLNRKRTQRPGISPEQEMQPVGPGGDKDKKNKRDKNKPPTPSPQTSPEQPAPPADNAKTPPEAQKDKDVTRKPSAQSEPTPEPKPSSEKSDQTTEPKPPSEKTEQPSGQKPPSEKSEQPAEPTTPPKPQLEKGEQADFNKRVTDRQRKRNAKSGRDDSDTTVADNEDAPPQAYEFLTIKLAQKYFIDRHFGGALIDGQRNQFYPINTLSGFTYGGQARSFSPVNVAVRYSPLARMYADLRMDVGSDGSAVRNMIIGGGFRTDQVNISASYYLSRKIEIAPNSFEAGTFPGNQITTTFQYGDGAHGLYGGSRIGYDFTDRFTSATEVSKGRLRNSRSYFGYAWDCCGVQFNYNTFKAGLRNESAFSFTFTLAGLGSFGTDQFSQLGGGRGGRKRGKKRRSFNPGDEDDSLP
jgi:lipopolysaccharide assembly outer membrane protein LptD (OstA)